MLSWLFGSKDDNNDSGNDTGQRRKDDAGDDADSDDTCTDTTTTVSTSSDEEVEDGARSLRSNRKRLGPARRVCKRPKLYKLMYLYVI